MMDIQEIGAALARQEERIKTLFDRMGNLEKLTDSVNKLAISLERLTAKEASLETKVSDIGNDVEEMKAKPGKHWEAVIAAVISALVGAGIALMVK